MAVEIERDLRRGVAEAFLHHLDRYAGCEAERRTVVAVLGKKEIPAGTVRSILAQWGIDEERLAELLGK